MSYEDSTSPTKVEAWLESMFPSYNFRAVLVLLLATFVVMAAGPSDAWARVLTVTIQSLTLLCALLAARTGRRLFRIAAGVTVIAIVSSIVSVIASSSTVPTGVYFGLNVLLVGAAPVAIAAALYRRAIIDIHTVLGAICIYVLLGMMFAFLYAAVSELAADPFFAQTAHATLPNILYFSFITQTTVGYGDFTAAADLGRTLAALEALIGQLYLVTVLALLVGRMVSSRGVTPAPPHPLRRDEQ